MYKIHDSCVCSPSIHNYSNVKPFITVPLGSKLDGYKVGFNPRNYTQLAFNSLNGINLLNIDTHEYKNIPETDSRGLSTFSYSPNGKYIAIACEECIGIWDKFKGKKRSAIKVIDTNTLKEHRKLLQKNYVTSLSFHPRENKLAIGTENTFYIYDFDTNTKKTIDLGGNQWIHSITFHPDTPYAAILTRLGVNVWDLSSQTKVATYSAFYPDSSSQIAYSPDGQYLVYPDSYGVFVAQHAPRGMPLSPSVHIERYQLGGPLAFAPDRRLALGFERAGVNLYSDVESALARTSTLFDYFAPGPQSISLNEHAQMAVISSSLNATETGMSLQVVNTRSFEN